ncbi:unnamed protein product [Amoebophrya sp. A25]|nr:unnamed protein product [Amoebophrya sp. A25]|eukprot:GSA25T00016263001.1
MIHFIDGKRLLLAVLLAGLGCVAVQVTEIGDSLSLMLPGDDAKKFSIEKRRNVMDAKPGLRTWMLEVFSASLAIRFSLAVILVGSVLCGLQYFTQRSQLEQMASEEFPDFGDEDEDESRESQVIATKEVSDSATDVETAEPEPRSARSSAASDDGGV